MVCNNCPRQCQEKKWCQSPDNFKINIYQLHFWEEPFISGKNGSGAIFFSHCNLKCVFCQNYEISQLHQGKIYTEKEFIEICYSLKEMGAHNINLVSPTCYHNLLVKALKKLKNEKFPLPIVWNSNGYEKKENIKELEGLVDIYLPDLKYSDDNLAFKYSFCKNYFEIAKEAILEMARQKKDYKFENGILKEGLVVRHLVLPSCLDNSKGVLVFLRENLGKDVWISLMSQYTPLWKASLFPEINRKLTEKEYQEICEFALNLGFENILVQDLTSAKEKFIPDFLNYEK